MRLSTLNAAVLGLVFLVFGSAVRADDLEELKRRIVAAKEEAAELRDRGQTEEAEAVDREVDELTREAKRVFRESRPDDNTGDRKKGPDQNHPKIPQLKERLHNLSIALKKAGDASEEERHELRELIHRTEQELAEAVRPREKQPREEILPQFRERAEELEMAGRRIHHIRVAAENLEAAEMHDMAHDLMEKAEAMEQELHAARAALAEEMRGVRKQEEPEHRGEFQELRAENKRLRQELNELREAVERLREERD